MDLEFWVWILKKKSSRKNEDAGVEKNLHFRMVTIQTFMLKCKLLFDSFQFSPIFEIIIDIVRGNTMVCRIWAKQRTMLVWPRLNAEVVYCRLLELLGCCSVR